MKMLTFCLTVIFGGLIGMVSGNEGSSVHLLAAGAVKTFPLKGNQLTIRTFLTRSVRDTDRQLVWLKRSGQIIWVPEKKYGMPLKEGDYILYDERGPLIGPDDNPTVPDSLKILLEKAEIEKEAVILATPVPIGAENVNQHDPARIADGVPTKSVPTQLPKENTSTDSVPAYIIAALVAMVLLLVAAKRAHR